MTEDQLRAVIARGAKRLAKIPAADQEHALDELRAAATKIARGCGYSGPDCTAFAEDLIATLRATAASMKPRRSRTIH